MEKKQRLIIAIRSKFPGNKTEEGINFKQAAEELGVSRAALINWIRDANTDIKSSNWKSISKVTGYSRAWLEEGTGPEKLTEYKQTASGAFSINESTQTQQSTLIKIKWHNLCVPLHPFKITEHTIMPINRNASKTAFAIEIESNQFSPYVYIGETIIIEPELSTHGRKILVEIDNEFFILEHNKLQNAFFDLNGDKIKTDKTPNIIGPITNIYGAVREG